MENRKSNQTTKERPVIILAKCLAGAWVLTGVALGILAFVLYRFGLSEKAVAAAMVVLYAVIPFASGWIAGKVCDSRAFLWGLILGGSYFVMLFLISLIWGKGEAGEIGRVFTTACLCCGGGMLGGMVSAVKKR